MVAFVLTKESGHVPYQPLMLALAVMVWRRGLWEVLRLRS